MSKSTPLKSGQKFGRLTIISLHHISNKFDGKRKRVRYYYLCKCECGKEKVILKDNLGRLTNSCGCISKQLAKKRLLKHGLCNTRLYDIWESMKQRCFYENSISYRNYGGRGITVCDEWKQSFIAFYKWATSNGYQENLTIDRINLDGDYEPTNCRFITMKEQGRNKRNNRVIEYRGESHCISEWAEKMKIKKTTLYQRLKNGWDVEKAFKYK